MTPDIRTVACALVTLLALACGPGAERREDPAPRGRLDDRVTPLAYRLDFEIDPRAERFRGSSVIDVRIHSAGEVLWIHGLGLTVHEARYRTEDGRVIEATYEEVLPTGVARLSFPEALAPGPGRLEFRYDAPFDENLAGLYVFESAGERYALTQMEATEARRAFPAFDEPRFKTPFTVSITAPANDVVIANSPESGVAGAPGGGRIHQFAPTRPLPTYLVAFTVGPYDVNEATPMPPTPVRDEEIPLRGIAPKGLGQRFDHALGNTRGLLEELEAYFALPYPYGKLDLIATPAFSHGAMENPGAIVYRDTLMLLDADSPLEQRRSHVLVHAHEMAHQWFGNLVTPAWWNDIWLNEAFATWMGNRTSAAWNPAGSFLLQTRRRALEAMDEDSLASARRVREPVMRNEDIENAFNPITYGKGGGVLSMFESYLGAEAFREGVRLHLRRFADGVATSDDFMASIAEGSGRPEVVPAMRTFLDQPGVPLVRATLDCAGGRPAAHLAQSPYHPLGSTAGADRRWLIPACVSYEADGVRRRSCGLIQEDELVLPLEASRCPVALMPNAGGAGYYRFALDTAGWKALIAAFDGLEPGEQLALADNVFAGFEAGDASAETLVALLGAAARSTSWEVAENVAAAARRYRNTLLDADGRAALGAFMRAAYAPRLAAGDTGTDPNHELFVAAIVEGNVIDWADPLLSTSLARSALSYLEAVEEGRDASEAGLTLWALDPALTAAVRQGGAPVFDRLLAAVQTTRDPLLRTQGLAALAQTEDPTLAARLREATLAGPLTGREFHDTLEKQLERSETRVDAWAWLTANAAEVRDRLPSVRRARLPGMVKHFCAREEAAAVRAMFEANAALFPGYEPALARAVEAIELCAALRDARGRELTEALLAP